MYFSTIILQFIAFIKIKINILYNFLNHKNIIINLILGLYLVYYKNFCKIWLNYKNEYKINLYIYFVNQFDKNNN